MELDDWIILQRLSPLVDVQAITYGSSSSTGGLEVVAVETGLAPLIKDALEPLFFWSQFGNTDRL
jgi:hypothetical protein